MPSTGFPDVARDRPAISLAPFILPADIVRPARGPSREANQPPACAAAHPGLAGYTTLWIAHWGVTSPTVPAGNWAGYG